MIMDDDTTDNGNTTNNGDTLSISNTGQLSPETMSSSPNAIPLTPINTSKYSQQQASQSQQKQKNVTGDLLYDHFLNQEKQIKQDDDNNIEYEADTETTKASMATKRKNLNATTGFTRSDRILRFLTTPAKISMVNTFSNKPESPKRTVGSTSHVAPSIYYQSSSDSATPSPNEQTDDRMERGKGKRKKGGKEKGKGKEKEGQEKTGLHRILRIDPKAASPNREKQRHTRLKPYIAQKHIEDLEYLEKEDEEFGRPFVLRPSVIKYSEDYSDDDDNEEDVNHNVYKEKLLTDDEYLVSSPDEASPLSPQKRPLLQSLSPTTTPSPADKQARRPAPLRQLNKFMTVPADFFSETAKSIMGGSGSRPDEATGGNSAGSRSVLQALKEGAGFRKVKKPPAQQLPAPILFPLVPSALVVPFNRFLADDKGRHGPPIIFEAVRVQIIDVVHHASDLSSQSLYSPVTPLLTHPSIDNPAHATTDYFVIQVEYGPLKWIVYRKLFDFLQLHFQLSLRSRVVRSLPALPDFMKNQLSLFLQEAKIKAKDAVVKVENAMENMKQKATAKTSNIVTSLGGGGGGPGTTSSSHEPIHQQQQHQQQQHQQELQQNHHHQNHVQFLIPPQDTTHTYTGASSHQESASNSVSSAHSAAPLLNRNRFGGGAAVTDTEDEESLSPSRPSLGPRTHTAVKLNRLQSDRRNALEMYLRKLLQVVTMKVSVELCQFLEISRVSLLRDIGSKGREGILDLRVGGYKAWCLPLVFGKFKPVWCVVKDSYVALCSSLSEPPFYIALADSTFSYAFNPNSSSSSSSSSSSTKSKSTLFAKKVFKKLKRPKSTLVIGGKYQKVMLQGEFNLQMQLFLESLEKLVSSEWCVRNKRFNSFSPERRNVQGVCGFVDAVDYCWAVSEAIASAKETIYIAGWWLSPEFYLRRPCSQYPEFRLDRLLKRKASEGVKIYVLIYKEITFALPLQSAYTKQTLQKLDFKHIKVLRDPDHNNGGTLLWAHHEKLVVVDSRIAFTGGVDLAYGRYDEDRHVLCDGDNTDELWPGLHYSNPRVRDFQNVHLHESNLISKEQVARMPWHDIGVMVCGEPASDLARHFIERWNWVKTQKGMHRMDVPMLLPLAPVPSHRVVNAPEYASLMAYIKSTNRHYDYHNGCVNASNSVNVQVVRSAEMWSAGASHEKSIYNAYLKLIEEAEHYVYIENQFFITSASDENAKVHNRIGEALAKRILRAASAGQKFRVIIVMPLLPAFEGSEFAATNAQTMRVVMHYQYMSLSRGGNSLIERLTKEGLDWKQYIGVFGLRNWGQLQGSGRKVSEMVYVHSKLMIVDDRRVIIGSANINDRSMAGNRDSELALVLEDQEMVQSQMNGKLYLAGKFALNFRKRIFREHLGLLRENDTIVDPLLNDLLSDEFYFGFLRRRAESNTLVYRNVFRPIPDDTVATWEEYRKFLEADEPVMAGHVWPGLSEEYVDSELKKVQGALVDFPLDFLKQENLGISMLSKEFLLPIEVFI